MHPQQGLDFTVYIPKHFEQTDLKAMHALITSHPFATLVTIGAEGLCANHLPVELCPEPQPYGTLIGHVARANPVWREFANGHEAMLIFQSSDTYITPSWYPSKAETGKVVPTWNYAVVHAHGPLRAITDPQWLKAHVERLTNQHEAAFAQPWALADAPGDFVEKLIGGIIGVEMTISRLVGKWKTSQNRPEADQRGVVDGLRELGTPEARQMAEYVAQLHS